MKEPRKPTKSILITFEGNTTRATLLTGYTGDTRARTAFAKYNPDDAKEGLPYSEFEGARIAVARLFGLEPFVKDDEPQFAEGDIVRIGVNSPMRDLHTGALAKVTYRAPNKMTPYLVRVLDDAKEPCTPFDTLTFAGEMDKIEVKR